MNINVLLVDDDAVFAEVLRHNLVHEGFDVQVANGGGAARECILRCAPDVALLDITLPGESGLELCATWQHTYEFPVIILSARTQKGDRLKGLNSGADDYVTKPFDLEELVARIRVVLRRTRPVLTTLTLGQVTIDFGRYCAADPSGPLVLTAREFDLLRFLGERPGRTVHRDELLRRVWGYASPPFTRAVDKAVERLRRKIEPDPHRPRYIHTAHGDGYCLTP